MRGTSGIIEEGNTLNLKTSNYPKDLQQFLVLLLSNVDTEHL